MRRISESEQMIMLALWSCGKPATRNQIQQKLPASVKWADTTVLAFLSRLEEKGYLTVQKQGNRNVYSSSFSKTQYLQNSAVDILDELFEGKLLELLKTLVEADRLNLEGLEQTKVWIEEQLIELGDYDNW